MKLDLNKKVSTEDDFELTYLRWGYAKKVMGVELDDDGLVKEGYDSEALQKIDLTFFDRFKPTVKWHSNKHYQDNKPLYQGLGFSFEDIENIGLYHLTIYLALYSLSSNEEKRNEWEKTFTKSKGCNPTDDQIFDKDRANFINFLKQRFSQLSRISNQKLKNVGVGYRKSLFYFVPADVAIPDEITHEEAVSKGFKRVGIKELATLKKALGKKFNYQEFVTPEGKRVVNIVSYITQALAMKDDSDMTQEDYFEYLRANNSYHEPNFHELRPDEMVDWKSVSRAGRIADLAEKYKKSSVKTKISMIKRFLKHFSNDPKFKEEVRIATHRLWRLKREERA